MFIDDFTPSENIEKHGPRQIDERFATGRTRCLN